MTSTRLLVSRGVLPYLVGFLAVGVVPLGACGDTNVTVICNGGEAGDVNCEDGVCACTEEGIRAAITVGGGPFTFSCDGPTTVKTEAEIVIDNDVILDGEGNMTLDANGEHSVLWVHERVAAELRGFAVTGGNANALEEGNGGGIINDGDLTIADCSIRENVAFLGGGISNIGTLTLTRSTVSGNSASRGGGIFNEGMATLTNSTISGNTDDGISNDGTMMLISVTVDGYQTPLFGISSDGTLTVMNSLIVSDCQGDIVSGGYNIESEGDSCGFDQVTDLVGVAEQDLMLAPFADNGGPTETRALLPGSVAIDKIPAEDCEVETDQRGFPRDSMCDVGAFEVQP